MFASLARAYIVYPLCERYEGREIRSKLSRLRDVMRQPYGLRRRQQEEALAHSAQRAAVDVPYYRDLFSSIGFDPVRLTLDVKWLQDIPFLTKEIVREQGHRLLSERLAPNGRHERKTGGSTGLSALFYYSAEALDWSAAAHFLAYEWTGKFRHHREIHLSSRFPESFPLRDRLKEWVKCQAMNRVNVTTHAFDDQGLEDSWRQIRKVRPGLLQGHPSTITALARYVERSAGLSHGCISRIQCTGEILTDTQRDTMERVFGARVFNSYGNAELGVIAQQTHPSQTAGLRVIDPMAWVEEDQGEIVASNLTNPLMPLLRYRCGDLGKVSEQADGRYIHSIVGRIHDVVTIGDRSYPTHYLQDLLDRLGGIEDFQLQQLPDGCLRIRMIVPHQPHQEGLRQRLQSWWGDKVTAEFITPADIVRVGWRGKFRYLIPEDQDAIR